MYASGSRNVYMYAHNCQSAFLNNEKILIDPRRAAQKALVSKVTPRLPFRINCSDCKFPKIMSRVLICHETCRMN